MDIFLPEGFDAGRTRRPMGSRQRERQQLWVEASGVYHPVLRRWATGFAVAADQVPMLRGVVTLYNGAEMLHQCLITDKVVSDGEVAFSIKKSVVYDYAAATEGDPSAQPDLY